MIFDVLKSRWLRKQQERLRRDSRESLPKTPRSLIVLYDADVEQSTLFLEQWSNDLGIEKVTVVTFTKDVTAVSTPQVVVLNSKSIKWNGGIADQQLEEILNASYDLQINFFQRANDLQSFVALALRSGFKVGLPTQQKEHYDLSIDVELSEKQVFITELKKYIKIITH